MTTPSLPTMDTARTEFDFARTICSCTDCVISCRHMPGYLIAADLNRIKQHLRPGENLLAWASTHLLASPGAVVARKGRVFRIPTLVPARRSDGACTFLTEQNRCAIHAVAPYGCAFFDSHMSRQEADRRSCRGLHTVMEAWAKEALYAQLWNALDAAGLRAPPPEVCRRRILHTRKETTCNS